MSRVCKFRYKCFNDCRIDKVKALKTILINYRLILYLYESNNNIFSMKDY